MEKIIISLVFVGALFYLGRLVYRMFFSKEVGCAKGCGTCSAMPTETNNPV
ncbi:FeoB-associated Cys-rich membrane protein [Aquirufa sp. OSTEICH-129A]